MNKILQHITLFFLLNLLLLILILRIGNLRLKKFSFNNSNTESKKYDVVILGSSHARSLSRSGNHQRMENILEKKIANLAKGHGAGGIKNQYLYLSYFLDKGNTADTLIYFIDPFVFYNDYMDNNNFIYNNEPFSIDFALHIIRHGTRTETFLNYLKYKLKPYWWAYQPDSDTAETAFLTTVDSAKFNKRLAVMYPDELKKDVFDEKVKRLQKLTALAQQHNMKIIFIIPPTLMGKLPAHDNMLNMLQANYSQIPVYDFSLSISQPPYYYDLDHLNTSGVVYFMENYVKEVL
jgi:hypothetical protein